MEEIIHEYKVVETEDGFRIEIKGDKERIREMLKRFPFGMGMPGKPFGRRGRGFGPGDHGPRAWKFRGRHGRGRRGRHGHKKVWMAGNGPGDFVKGWGPKGIHIEYDFEEEDDQPSVNV